MRPTVRRALAATAMTATAVALVAAVPRVAGTTWGAVAALVTGIDVRWLGALAVVWFAGLLGYTLVLTASLPGLRTSQALQLNLAGSAVANSVPLGGAASMGLTTAMARSWGFAPTQIGAFLLVSNLWTIGGRVLIGVLGLTWWAAARPDAAPQLGLGALLAPAVALLVLGAVLGSQARTGALARAAGALVDRVDTRRGRPARHLAARAARAAVEMRATSLRLSLRTWRRFVLGTVAYPALLVLLLDVCLHAVGHAAALVVVVAAVGAERLAAAVPVTPGGVGVAEIGMVAVLTAGGVSPAVAAASALLYRIGTFGLEIPVGGGVALAWVAVGRRRHCLRPAGVTS